MDTLDGIHCSSSGLHASHLGFGSFGLGEKRRKKIRRGAPSFCADIAACGDCSDRYMYELGDLVK